MPPPVPSVPYPLPDDILSDISTEQDVQEQIDKQGWLIKEGHLRKNWKRRWFVLQGETLTYFDAPDNLKKPKGVIHLETCAVHAKHREDIRGETGTSDCLEIVTADRKLYFVAESTKDMEEWVSALKNRITFLNYLKKLRAMHQSPDSRVIRLFKNRDTSVLLMDNTPLSMEAVFAIAAPIRSAHHLVHLSLRNSGLSDIAMQCDLARGLQENRSLEILNLALNELGPDAATDLAGMLKNNSRIRVLCLDGNRIGDKGVCALASALPSCGLTHLSLASNDITDDGVAELCKALHVPVKGAARVFPSLRLSKNVLTDACIKDIAELCLTLPSLTTLLLDQNQIGNNGAMTMAETLLSGSCSVTDINLSHNTIGTPGASALADLILRKPSIVSLDLSSNRIGEEGLIALDKQRAKAMEFFSLSFERRK